MQEFKALLMELSEDYSGEVSIMWDSSCVEDTITVWFSGQCSDTCTVFYHVDKTWRACGERVLEIIDRLVSENA